jgi:radical SAM-linked protein
MDSAQATGDSPPEQRFRWAFFYSVGGDLRFISHHDTLRMFRRAFARVDLPLRFTQGFNPHPRMTIPLPRPVGIASDAEAIVVETTAILDTEAVLKQLQESTPSELRFTDVRMLEANEKLQPRAVRYRIDASDPEIKDLGERRRHLLETTVVPVERRNPKNPGGTTVDVRPYVDTIDLVDGAVEMTLLVTENGTAKPAEIATLLGYPADAINHRIRRLEIKWQ